MRGEVIANWAEVTMRRLTIVAILACASSSAFAQAPGCADVAGKYFGIFKARSRVCLEIEPSCKITSSSNAGSSLGQGAMKGGHLIAKFQGVDFDLVPKDSKLVGVFSYATYTDRDITFSKVLTCAP